MDPITQRLALGAAGAAGGNTYFIDRIRYGSSGTNYAATQGNYVDSDGNLYDVGKVLDLTYPRGFIMKRDAQGVIQWSRTLSDASGAVLFSHVASDGTYLYVVGQGSNAGVASILVVAYDLNGTLQWQKHLHASSTSNVTIATSITVDSSGNVYVNARENDGTYTPVGPIKLNSSGVPQWGKGYYYAASPAYTYNEKAGICVDSNDNVVVDFRMHSGNSLRTSAALIKLNSSGTLQWDLVYYPGGTAFPNFNYSFGTNTDSNDNIYWGINYDLSGTSDHYLAKINPSGVLQSSIELGTGSTYPQPYVDHEDNVWTTGQSYLQSWDTSLTNNFSRSLSGGSYGNLLSMYYGQPFRASGSDGIYVSNKTDNSSYRGFTFYLPADGSLTGTYDHPIHGLTDYSVYSETIGSGASFSDLGSLTEISWSPVTTTATYTDASETFSSDPYFIG